MTVPQPPLTDEYLRLFDADRDRAASKLADLFSKLVKFFEWRNCESPEDLAQETLTRGLARIAAGVDIYIDDPGHYFYGIARFVVMEARKSARQRPDPLEDEIPGASKTDSIEAAICLDQFFARLPADDRDLIWRYHTEDRERLCRDLDLSSTVLRVRVHRILRKLRQLSLRPDAGGPEMNSSRGPL